ncbi:hypothetical protein L596_004339 [Steinernema carpocapsae]|uniref:ZP domain-containing protein n=1 Tax=Steinernema carpocapsae TaxID=34508 RepID=A0A4U8UVI6_STECR|nr:hypothetical protein L596_004339 [Steinernema carpocapsae]
MKAFRLDGSYDIQIKCQVMFCAGPNGCPPSNCLDSGTNELFGSHGRKKRSVDDDTQSEETLSAIIRVLAKGEEDAEVEQFYRNMTVPTGFDANNYSDLVCMSEVWFVSTVVSVSLVCLMLSALIVIWGCHSLRQAS